MTARREFESLIEDYANRLTFDMVDDRRPLLDFWDSVEANQIQAIAAAGVHADSGSVVDGIATP